MITSHRNLLDTGTETRTSKVSVWISHELISVWISPQEPVTSRCLPHSPASCKGVLKRGALTPKNRRVVHTDLPEALHEQSYAFTSKLNLHYALGQSKGRSTQGLSGYNANFPGF